MSLLIYILGDAQGGHLLRARALDATLALSVVNVALVALVGCLVIL